EEEAASRTLVAVTIADDLVGKIKLGAVEPPVFFHMRFIAVGSDSDILRGHRHLRRRDIAQFEKGREEAAIARGEADAQAWQVRALGQRVEDNDIGEVRA